MSKISELYDRACWVSDAARPLLWQIDDGSDKYGGVENLVLILTHAVVVLASPYSSEAEKIETLRKHEASIREIVKALGLEA